LKFKLSISDFLCNVKVNKCITPIELKNVDEFSVNNWKSLSDLGKSNVESKPIPISRKAL
jgi:hypothetical protein